MTKSHQTSKSSRLKTGLCGLAMLGLVSLVFTSIGCESGLSGNAIGEQSATPATNETDAEAPSGWELIGEESGFVTHRKAVEGSSVFAFRGETVVDVPLSKILTVFLDSDRRKDWGGTLRNSSIDARRCGESISNDNGSLVCEGSSFPHGSYIKSCKKCRYKGALFACSCADRNGNFGRTRIDYEQCGNRPLANIDGNLECEN